MRTVILANGAPPTAADISAWLRPGDRLYCADGGGRAALALGLRPTLVIGDFDSLDAAALEALRARGAVIERHPTHKDETDLELAVLRAAREGAEDIVILGALGGRFDHALANALLLGLPALARVRARLAAGPETVMLLRGPGTLALEGAAGDLISLLPLGEATGITTEGLEYPLREERLGLGPARGVSNVMLGPRASVRVEQGALLCVQIREAGSNA